VCPTEDKTPGEGEVAVPVLLDRRKSSRTAPRPPARKKQGLRKTHLLGKNNLECTTEKGVRPCAPSTTSNKREKKNLLSGNEEACYARDTGCCLYPRKKKNFSQLTRLRGEGVKGGGLPSEKKENCSRGEKRGNFAPPTW